MFDIDGTLIESMAFDSQCYQEAIAFSTGLQVDDNWSQYRDVTDIGILEEIIENHSLELHREKIILTTQKRFSENISRHIQQHGVTPIVGAPQFINDLQQREDVTVALATGGWCKTAELKLQAAGIDYENLILSTSSENRRRIDIMKSAESRCGHNGFASITYFGDADWDRQASRQLGYRFVRIGSKSDEDIAFRDFSNSLSILSAAGQPAGQQPKA